LRIVGLGVGIWLVAFVVASIFIALGRIDAIAAKLIVPLAVGVAAYFAGRMLKLQSYVEMLRHSALWVAIAIVLDALVTVPFAGWQIFAQWNVWLGLALVLTAPLLAVRNRA
jgi:hypothetical protein